MTEHETIRVAVIGPVAFPAVAGGLTRHCEELYGRLSSRGVAATVFVRRPYMTSATDRHGAVRIVAVPTPRRRGIETVVYGAIATLRALFGAFDVVHYHGVAAGFFCWMQRLRPGRRLLFTHHRADWTDEKWGTLAKMFLRSTARISLWVAHEVVAVSESLAADLREIRDRPIHVISNGITLPPIGSPEMLASFGLVPGRYALCVGRIVPEKGVHVVVEAFDNLERDGLALAVVGAPRYSEPYASALARRAGPNVRFLGQQSGETLGALYANASVFVTASLNEGNPLGVLEAMGFGLPIVASDIAAHREVLRGSGTLFDPRDAEALAEALRRSAERTGVQYATATDEYSWETIADRTLAVLRRLMGAHGA